MAKNRGKDTKQKNKKEKAFIVSTIKKGKTKSVSTNLKKLNVQCRAKTEKVDEKFEALKQVVIDSSKSAAKKTTNIKQKASAATQSSSKEPVDMETTTQDFAKL